MQCPLSVFFAGVHGYRVSGVGIRYNGHAGRVDASNEGEWAFNNAYSLTSKFWLADNVFLFVSSHFVEAYTYTYIPSLISRKFLLADTIDVAMTHFFSFLCETIYIY